MGRIADSGKRELWRRRFREFDTGNWTVVAFCERLGVSVPTFYQWRRKLATPPRSDQTLTFVPVAISTPAGIEVHLPGGVRMTIASSDDPAIQSVIRAILRVNEASEESC